jgi:hypothetical protein
LLWGFHGLRARNGSFFCWRKLRGRDRLARAAGVGELLGILLIRPGERLEVD